MLVKPLLGFMFSITLNLSMKKSPPFCDKRTFEILYKIKTYKLLSP